MYKLQASWIGNHPRVMPESKSGRKLAAGVVADPPLKATISFSAAVLTSKIVAFAHNVLGNTLHEEEEAMIDAGDLLTTKACQLFVLLGDMRAGRLVDSLLLSIHFVCPGNSFAASAMLAK